MKKFFIFPLLVLVAFPSLSNALCVISDKANLRSGPSPSSKLVWTVGKYMPFVETGRKGGWIKVKDVDGKQMWIFSGLVTSRIDCAVIKVNTSFLRKGPGKRFPYTPLASVYKYTPFRKLDRDGAWIKVQDDHGYKHWVFEQNIWEPLEYARLSY